MLPYWQRPSEHHDLMFPSLIDTSHTRILYKLESFCKAVSILFAISSYFVHVYRKPVIVAGSQIAQCISVYLSAGPGKRLSLTRIFSKRHI